MRRRRKLQISANSRKYRDAFIRHVHLLLFLGYARLDRSLYSRSEEPEISGALCEAIEHVLDDPKSEEWVDDYEVHDDPPVHDPTRKGKHRRRVDIRLASRVVRPRLRFCFEAKLLGAKNGAAKYVGRNGLGRFLEGSYAFGDEVGGMLGYVQFDDCDTWAERISASLNSAEHKTTETGDWNLSIVIDELTHTFRTEHWRPNNFPVIEIFHTLLSFTSI